MMSVAETTIAPVKNWSPGPEHVAVWEGRYVAVVKFVGGSYSDNGGRHYVPVSYARVDKRFDPSHGIRAVRGVPAHLWRGRIALVYKWAWSPDIARVIAEFVSACRNVVPDLLAELREQREHAEFVASVLKGRTASLAELTRVAREALQCLEDVMCAGDERVRRSLRAILDEVDRSGALDGVPKEER